MLGRLLLIGCISALTASTIQSQSLSSFTYLGDPYGGESYLGVSYAISVISNPVVPNSKAHNNTYRFGEVNWKKHQFDKGKFRYDLDLKLYFDLIRIVTELTEGNWQSYYRQESTGLSTGLTGWHSMAWNIKASDRFTLALGFNHHDYFYGSSVRPEDSDNEEFPPLITNEPQGYYFSAGPTVMGDILVNRFMLIHLKTTYSLSYARTNNISYAVKDDSYPLPHWFGLSAELTTPWGIFIEIDRNQLINRGDIASKGIRTDINFGFKFVL